MQPTRRRLINRSTGRVLGDDVEIASGFRAQLTGLIGRDIPPGRVLGMPGCRMIHTAFVCGLLDVVYCDNQGRVRRITSGMKPYRIGPWIRDSAIVWEAAAGTLAPHVAPGDVLECVLRD